MIFANVKDWIIPEGSVERVADSLGIVIWQKQGHDYSKDSFYVENATGSDNTLTIKKYNASAPTVEVFKSTDTVNWTSMGNTDTTGITATIPAYGRVYLRATTSRWCGTDNISNYNFINCSGNFRVGGNIMSLLKGTAFYNTTLSSNNTWAFASLFHSYNNPYSRLVSAKDLILPSNTADYCYYRMFDLCSYLTETPVLPATTMTTGCYNSMFYGCTGLTTAPVLPATTLANDCYRVMFRGCSALTTAPVLPATTLVENCYFGMFWNCTSLNQVTTYANDITATDCISSWLSGVAATGTFNNRGSATYPVNSASGIPTGWTEQQYFYVEDISGNNTTLSIKKYNSSTPTIEVFYSTDQTNWTSMGTTDTTPITATVPANGKLYLKATANAWATSGLSNNQISVSDKYNIGGNIMSLLNSDNFEGTTFTNSNDYAFPYLFEQDNNLVNANELILPSNVVNSCYLGMFQGCTSLTSAPALPATTLAEQCYQNMFSGCSSLTTAPALPATTLAEQCYTQMFQGCTSLTTAPALPATTLTNWCYSGMFDGCTSLTSAPALPATTLANYCYFQMFKDCISLTTAPALPATTLANYCYTSMFDGCTSLNEVTIYADDISATSCLFTWLKNVAATGDFYNLGSATYPSGTSGIPTGWTEHNTL